MARPKLPTHEKHSEKVEVRFTTYQFNAIQEAARAVNLPLAIWIRNLALEHAREATGRE